MSDVHFDRKAGQFVGLTEEQMRGLTDAYPGVDITRELKRMCLWMLEKGQRRKGNMAFIMNWLNRATPTMKVSTTVLDTPEDEIANAMMAEYLKDLWREREYLLKMNKRT